VSNFGVALHSHDAGLRCGPDHSRLIGDCQSSSPITIPAPNSNIQVNQTVAKKMTYGTACDDHIDLHRRDHCHGGKSCWALGSIGKFYS
jgi:hypothetical protein